jgi:hypothetical protein
MKKRGRLFGHFKLQMALAQLCKITTPYLCKHPNTSTTKGKNSIGKMSSAIALFFSLQHRKQQILRWRKIKEINPLVLGQ